MPDGLGVAEDETTTDEADSEAEARRQAKAGRGARRLTDDTATATLEKLGVVAPPDPHVPPLPADGSGATPVGAAPGQAERAPDPDGTETATAIMPDAIRAGVATEDGDAPTVEAAVPAPPGGQINLAPLPAPRFPSLVSVEERSSDFSAEARRLGGEAKQAAEVAGRAAALAAAAGRAAALAGEASMLAAVGDQHGASQRLLEAQLVDEALRRGEIPSKSTIQPGAGDIDQGVERWFGRVARVLSSREGVTIIVIVTIGLMLVVLFLSLLL